MTAPAVTRRHGDQGGTGTCRSSTRGCSTPRSGRALEHLAEPDLDEETSALFLSENARRVFRLGDPS
ncbi:hypothetical protein ACGFS9_18360 [Streptomyces sp. NPDC048566]|uniref:hypothetical protein n=1 Tax=Streptomyces sp. NPDC048566 TaxID=3365569 RepID=UPI0037177380